MDIATLIKGTGARLLDESAGTTRVCDVTEDSRSALPGSLFIARPGTVTDGRTFIADAVRAGASAVLTTPDTPKLSDRDMPAAWCVTDRIGEDTATIAERFFREPSAKLKLLGVTGTNGKTTIAHLVRQLLKASGLRAGLIGTIEVDDGRESSPASLTTPGAIELSYTLATMVENGLNAAALEVSSHALAQHRADALDFDVAVFTNLTGDHLDYHKTIDAYAKAKSRLFSMLKPSATAIINADDPHAPEMFDACACERVLRCSMSEESDAECHAEIICDRRTGTLARFAGPFGELETESPLIGAHNVMNTLQAIAAAYALTENASAIASELPKLAPPPGRLELVLPTGDRSMPFSVFVDYAHTDDALRATLSVLAPLAHRAHGKLHAVFGCGGDRDKTKRPRMASVACEFADRVTITSDNPRTEQPASIIRDVLEGIPDGCNAQVDIDADRAVAIRRAIENAGEEDIILVAGKGDRKSVV